MSGNGKRKKPRQSRQHHLDRLDSLLEPRTSSSPWQLAAVVPAGLVAGLAPSILRDGPGGDASGAPQAAALEGGAILVGPTTSVGPASDDSGADWIASFPSLSVDYAGPAGPEADRGRAAPWGPDASSACGGAAPASPLGGDGGGADPGGEPRRAAASEGPPDVDTGAASGFASAGASARGPAARGGVDQPVAGSPPTSGGSTAPTGGSARTSPSVDQLRERPTRPEMLALQSGDAFASRALGSSPDTDRAAAWSAFKPASTNPEAASNTTSTSSSFVSPTAAAIPSPATSSGAVETPTSPFQASAAALGASPGGGGGGTGGGGGASSGLFFDRPTRGGAGGLYQRAWNELDGTSGSDRGPVGVGEVARRTLDSLISRYVDAYFASIGRFGGAGGQSATAAGSDGVGNYTFSATLSYNYQDSGSALGAYTANSTDGFSYTFSEVGSFGGTSFTYTDSGSANSGSTGSGAAGTHTLTNVLRGTHTDTLLQVAVQSGGVAGNSSTATVTSREAGSETFTLGESPRRQVVDAGNAVLSGTNTYSFDLVGRSSYTLSATSSATDANTAGGGSMARTDSTSATEAGGGSYSLKMTATDQLGAAGAVTGGTRTATWTSGGSSSFTSTGGGVETASNTAGSKAGSYTTTATGADSRAASITATQTYSGVLGVGGSYSWNGSGADSYSLFEASSRSSTLSATFSSTLNGVTAREADRSSGTLTSTSTLTGRHTQLSMNESGTEAMSAGTVSTGNATHNWRQGGTSTIASRGTSTEASSVTATQSSTLAGVTATVTDTSGGGLLSTIARSGSDSHTLYETGTETKGAGGVVTGGGASDSLYQTANGVSTTLDRKQAGTGSRVWNDRSTIGGVTAGASFLTGGSTTGTLTGTLVDSSTLTGTLSAALGAGALAVGQSTSSTLYQVRAGTDDFVGGETWATSASVSQSSTLGGVTDQTTATYNQTVRPTYSLDRTPTTTLRESSSLSMTSWTVTGGRSGTSLYQTGVDVSGLNETGSYSSSGGWFSPGARSVRTSTTGGVTVSETMSSSGAGASVRTSGDTARTTVAASSTQTFGTLGILTGGAASSSLHGASSPVDSLYEVASATTTESATRVGVVMQAASSESMAATSTQTMTSTLTGLSAATAIETSTLTLGYAGRVLSGNSSATFSAAGSSVPSYAATGSTTANYRGTTSSTLAGASRSESASAAESGTRSATGGGSSTLVQGARNTAVLGLGGDLVGGNSTNSLYSSGVDGSSSSGGYSRVGNALATETAVLGLDNSSSSYSSSLSQSGTFGASSTISSTGVQTGGVVLNTAGVVSSGTASSSLGTAASGGGSLYETGTETSSYYARSFARDLNQTLSATDSGGGVGTYSSQSTASNDAIQVGRASSSLGLSGTIVGGGASDSLYSTGAGAAGSYRVGTVSETLSTSQSAGATSTSYSQTMVARHRGTQTSTLGASGGNVSTLTTTVALGADAAVLGGTSSSSLYETGSSDSSLFEISTDTTTEAGGTSFKNQGDQGSTSYSVTDALVGTASASSGAARAAQAYALTNLTALGVVDSGVAESTLYETASDASSLYQAGTRTSGSTSSLALRSGISGTLTSTSNRSETLGVASTLTGGYAATSTLASGADVAASGTLAGGGAQSSLHESQSLSMVDRSSGTYTSSASTGGPISRAETMTGTLTTTDSGLDLAASSLSASLAFGIQGVVVGGIQNSGSSSSHSYSSAPTDTLTKTVTESANTQTSTLTVRESSTDTGSRSGLSTLTFGAAGVVTGGREGGVVVASSSLTQSVHESGTQKVKDLVNNQTVTADLGRDDRTTQTLSSSSSLTQTLGAGGAVSGGDATLAWREFSTESHTLDSSGAGYTVKEVDTESYSLSKRGTETYGANGAVTGGSQTFTWDQQGSTSYRIRESGSGVHVFAYDFIDTLSTTWHDVGTESFGPSYSITRAVDLYSWDRERSTSFSVSDTTLTPTSSMTAVGNGSDRFKLANSGSATLENGIAYGSDTYTWTESSSDTSSIDRKWIDVIGNKESALTGTATGTYSISDVGTVRETPASPTGPVSVERSDTFSYAQGWQRSAVWTRTGSDVTGSSDKTDWERVTFSNQAGGTKFDNTDGLGGGVVNYSWNLVSDGGWNWNVSIDRTDPSTLSQDAYHERTEHKVEWEVGSNVSLPGGSYSYSGQSHMDHSDAGHGWGVVNGTGFDGGRGDVWGYSRTWSGPPYTETATAYQSSTPYGTSGEAVGAIAYPPDGPNPINAVVPNAVGPYLRYRGTGPGGDSAVREGTPPGGTASTLGLLGVGAAQVFNNWYAVHEKTTINTYNGKPVVEPPLRPDVVQYRRGPSSSSPGGSPGGGGSPGRITPRHGGATPDGTPTQKIPQISDPSGVRLTVGGGADAPRSPGEIGVAESTKGPYDDDVNSSRANQMIFGAFGLIGRAVGSVTNFGGDRIDVQLLADGRMALYYVDLGYVYNGPPEFIGYLDPVKEQVIRSGMRVPLATVQSAVDETGTTGDWTQWFRDNAVQESLGDQRNMWEDPTLAADGKAYNPTWRQNIAISQGMAKWLAEQGVEFTSGIGFSVSASKAAIASKLAVGERVVTAGMGGLGARFRSSNPGRLNPLEVNFSQRTVDANVSQYVESMSKPGGWDWAKSGPIRVMKRDGQWVSYDNRRLMAARLAGLKEVPVQIVDPKAMYSPTKTWEQAFRRRFADGRNVRAGGRVPNSGLSDLPGIAAPK